MTTSVCTIETGLNKSTRRVVTVSELPDVLAALNPDITGPLILEGQFYVDEFLTKPGIPTNCFTVIGETTGGKIITMARGDQC